MLTLTIVILICSAIQGVFGVGLLIFGTPSLILLGYPFDTTLALLLPSSIAISVSQTVQGYKFIEIKKQFFLFSVPLLLIGLFLVLNNIIVLDMKVLIASVLIVSSIIRLSNRVSSFVKNILKNNMRLYLMIMGLVHGVSNMGGALLTVYATSLYKNKLSIRSNIAYCYAIFGLSQFAVLCLFHKNIISIKSFIFIPLSLLIYMIVSRAVYNSASEKRYQILITGFMFLYGLTLLCSRLIFRL